MVALLWALLAALLFQTGIAKRIMWPPTEDDEIVAQKPHSGVSKGVSRQYMKAYRLTQGFFQALRDAQAAKKLIGETFQTFEKSVRSPSMTNPFALCGVGWEDLTDLNVMKDKFEQGAEESQNTPALLQFLGMKKKGGVFWKTPLPEPAGFLVKSVDNEEVRMLAGWVTQNRIWKYYPDCAAFHSTLLVPVLFTFAVEGQDYIVMRDETLRLKEVAGEHWEVVRKYDIKPLPNLSGDLSDLMSQLLAVLSGDSSPLDKWDGWQIVYDAIEKAVSLLAASDALDYSLFIHVLQPVQECADDGPCDAPVEGLDAAHGCIKEPLGKLLICVKILDYTTPRSIIRDVESYRKGGKFYEYSTKFLKALQCFGDMEDSSCDQYRAYAGVKPKVSAKSGCDAKAVAFVRSSLFEHQYQCKVSRPQMYWLQAVGGHPMEVREPEFAAAPQVRLIDILPKNSIEVAQALKALLVDSQEVGEMFLEYLTEAHNRSSEFARAQVDAIAPLPPAKAKECIEGIYRFARRTWWWKRSRNKDLQNILWSSQQRSVFIVREKPFLSSNSDVVWDMRFRGCFLETYLYRCQPIKGLSVTMNYTLTFGSLEILEVKSSEYSSEFAAWSRYHLLN